MRFYARRGTFVQCYFGDAPFVRISVWRYLFEKIVMLNKCLKIERD